MHELDRFEARLAAAVHAMADRAETDVDAVAVAERAIRSGRGGRLAWVWSSVPVPVGILLLLGLLVGLLAWSVAVGGPRGDQFPAVLASDEYVSGTETTSRTTDYSQTLVGDVTQLRGIAVTVISTMSDPRVSGTGTFSFGADLYSTAVGPAWGTYHLENAGGAWDGTCRGAGWKGGDNGARACWLAGSGAYEGYTYYLQVTSYYPDPGTVSGTIFRGSAPAH